MQEVLTMTQRVDQQESCCRYVNGVQVVLLMQEEKQKQSAKETKQSQKKDDGVNNDR